MIMNIENLSTIGSLDNFLQGNQAIAYSVLGDKTECYQFIRKTLVKFNYATCPKKDKGVIKINKKVFIISMLLMG